MRTKNRFFLGLIGCSIVTGIGMTIVHRCYSSTAADNYAKEQFARSMAVDPFGGNTVADKAAYWTLQSWTGDESVYTKARHEIETSGVSPKLLEARYALAAKAEAKLPIAQFRWGYALKKNLSGELPSGEAGEKDAAVFYSMTQAVDPRTYDYARLRYLVSIRSRDLVRLGERLLKQDPEDNFVKMHLAEDYAFDVGKYGNPVSKARALVICRQLLQENPKNPRYYAVLGNLYEMSYTQNHNAKDAAAAIVADQKYINLVGTDSDYMQMKRNCIAEIKADLAKDKQSVQFQR